MSQYKKLRVYLETTRLSVVRSIFDRECSKLLPSYPKNGCATYLGVVLRAAGLPVKHTPSAGLMVNQLRSLGWRKIHLEDLQLGDVGVTEDRGGIPGADHVYLIMSKPNLRGEVVISDNQKTKLHNRSLHGYDGRTPTLYGLRAPND